LTQKTPPSDLAPVDYEPGWASQLPEWAFLALMLALLAAMWGGIYWWRRDLFKSRDWVLDQSDRQLVFGAIVGTLGLVGYLAVRLF